MSDWVKRPFDAASDTDPLHYMLGISYTRSKAGQRAGASRAGGSRERDDKGTPRPSGAPDHEAIAKQKAFLAAHRPIWAWLMEHADVEIVCDPQAPHIIWGWLVTSGDTVVHAVGCKRSFTEREPGSVPLSVDLVSDLLGERLTKHQVCSLELPQLFTRGSGSIGLDRPREWSLDPTWLVSRMVGR